jgi:hypothetical protein
MFRPECGQLQAILLNADKLHLHINMRVIRLGSQFVVRGITSRKLV